MSRSIWTSRRRVFLAAGALILWKTEGDWFRWLAAFVLIFFPLGTLQTLIQVAGYDYTWVMLGSILWPTFLLFSTFFPTATRCRGGRAGRWGDSQRALGDSNGG